MVQAARGLTGLPIEHGLFNCSEPKGLYDGMCGYRWLTDLDERAHRDLITDVSELGIDRIDVASDVRPGRPNEKCLNAWCVRA